MRIYELMTKPRKRQQRASLSVTVRKLKAWRERNGLSQRAAAEVMKAGGLPMVLRTLQAWEIGWGGPDKWKALVLEEFLKKNAVVKNPPKFGKRILSETEVAEIRKLRAGGWELEKIAENYGISGSAVSRICSGNRHGNVRKV